MTQHFIIVFVLVALFSSIALSMASYLSMTKRKNLIKKINLQKLEEDLKAKLIISSASTPIHRLSHIEFKNITELIKKYLQSEFGRAIYEDLFTKFILTFIIGSMAGAVIVIYFWYFVTTSL